ncbi:MAG: hypothetical protein ACRCTZ_16530 [Sarcina sp.]
MEEVFTLLTSEDKSEIKLALKDIIVNQIKNDFEDYGCYLFDPNEIEEWVSEVREEVKDEVRVIFKEKLLKEMEEKLGL